MQVKLVVKKGSTRARVVHLQSAETIVGRRPDCDLRILSSQVSRRHCLLSMHDGQLSVEDLDSVNGTLVNGRRISGKQLLRPGDMLEIGPLRFTVHYEPTDEMRPVKEDSEVLEVLPLAAQGQPKKGYVLAGDDDDELDALPVLDEDSDFVSAKSSGKKLDEDDDDIPLADELEVLPQSGDLRSILSEMDDSETKPKPKRKRK